MKLLLHPRISIVVVSALLKLSIAFHKHHVQGCQRYVLGALKIRDSRGVELFTLVQATPAWLAYYPSCLRPAAFCYPSCNRWPVQHTLLGIHP